MIAILKKELKQLFYSGLGWGLLAAIWLLLGFLLFWVDGSSLLNNQLYVNTTTFFTTLHTIWIFVVPIVCMKSIANEKKSGTWDLLIAAPISHVQIVLGKIVSSFLLLVVSLLPAILYFYWMYTSVLIEGSMQFNTIYTGLFGSVFFAFLLAAVGVFSSSVHSNMLVAFIVNIVLNILFYWGVDMLSNFNIVGSLDFWIQHLSWVKHLHVFDKGVVSWSSVSLFVGLSIVCVSATVWNRKYKIITAIGLVLFVASFFIKNLKWDLTSDKRYSLSQTSVNVVNTIDQITDLKVLFNGNFPSEYKQYRQEVVFLLDELKQENSYIQINQINPQTTNLKEYSAEALGKKGIQPNFIQLEKEGEYVEQTIFPYILVQKGDKTIPISIFDKGANDNLSIEQLEFKLVNALMALNTKQSKTIFFLQDNGALPLVNSFDLAQSMGMFYKVDKTKFFEELSDQENLDNLLQSDVLIMPKPVLSFSEKEKALLDQYLMHGKSILLAIDAVNAEQDSLRSTKSMFALPYEQGLTDLLFSYGCRINTDLVTDYASATIKVSVGEVAGQAKYQDFNWPFFPLIKGNGNHIINTSIPTVKIEFGNSIDTVSTSSNVDKTILLQSSVNAGSKSVPVEIGLDLLKKQPEKEFFTKGTQTLGLLIEGQLESAYKNRIFPLTTKFVKGSDAAKLIVIADGDILSNQLHKGSPLPLGYDKWTNITYGNKEFIMNCIHYLMGNKEILQLREKKLVFTELDQPHILNKKAAHRLWSLLLPLGLLTIVFFIVNIIRKKGLTH